MKDLRLFSPFFLLFVFMLTGCNGIVPSPGTTEVDVTGVSIPIGDEIVEEGGIVQLKVGDSVQLTEILSPADATNKTVTCRIC